MTTSKIKLISKSKKGKERIARWGNIWRVKHTNSHSLMIVAESDPDLDDITKTPDSTRWILNQQDPDFNWELV